MNNTEKKSPETDPTTEPTAEAPAAEPDAAAPEHGEPTPGSEASEAEPKAETPWAGTADAPDSAVEEPAAEPDPAIEIAALNDKLLRALADGENLRRRAQRDREDMSKYAISGFAREMLAVADNLRRALDSLPEGAADDDTSWKGFVEGVELTERELQSVMARHGIEKLDPAGEKFNHDYHEALFEVPTGDAPPGTIVQVVEVGYVLKDRLLRPARVGVAKAVPEADAEEHRVDTTV